MNTVNPDCCGSQISLRQPYGNTQAALFILTVVGEIELQLTATSTAITSRHRRRSAKHDRSAWPPAAVRLTRARHFRR